MSFVFSFCLKQGGVGGETWVHTKRKMARPFAINFIVLVLIVHEFKLRL